MPQPSSQKDYLNLLVTENEFNAFCVDCQDNRVSIANITYGTYVCEKCSLEHIENFPIVSYLKPLDEVWDPYQLKITEVGGNKLFYEFMREY
jgi:Putative GTPase activating protein for Arf